MAEKKVVLTAEQIIAAQAGTPLELVNQVLISGMFSPAPEESLSDGDKIIGELTLFEKALFTVRNEVSDSHNSILNEWRNSGNELDHAEIYRLKNIHEFIDYFLWTSIKNRLAAMAYSHQGIAIKEGYKIVGITKREEESHAFSAGVSLGSLLRGFLESAIEDAKRRGGCMEGELSSKKVKGKNSSGKKMH